MLSQDGNTLAVSSHFEASDAKGINGDQTDKSIPQAGAVYVFTRTGTTLDASRLTSKLRTPAKKERRINAG